VQLISVTSDVIPTCPNPNPKPYHLIEVSNECDVHLADVNTTMTEVTALHKAVADRLHADFDGASGTNWLLTYMINDVAGRCRSIQCLHNDSFFLSSHLLPAVRPLVGGPTAAFPEWEIRNFSLWRDVMGVFLEGAGTASDFVSVHLYSTQEDLDVSSVAPRDPNNVEAILDLHEAASRNVTGRPLPHLVSEYGLSFSSRRCLTHPPTTLTLCAASTPR
jgi:hypothetical protein